MDKLLQYLRPFAVKVIARCVLYPLVAWLGMEASQAQEPATQVAEGLSAILIAVVTVLLERYHHKTDLAQEPK